ncbi:MAG: LPS export ABC transporter periplasmic protein LptC [Muribaculaceae bacterium]|nr:LPS export ABC transporter periplasmic protein LptC [Muribaculaceae bacterium]
MLPLIVVAVIFSTAVSVSLSSCGETERTYVGNITNSDDMPTMHTDSVRSLISDSGYTRYEITSPLWLMYDEAREPKWRFPDGLHVQQYDESFKPSATIDCDSATYFSAKRLWRLDGDVVMVNTLRDTFLTQQLFWDQNAAKVYSDSFIHIVRQDRIIEGYGFESNEQMTRFSVDRIQAIIPLRDMRREKTSAPSVAPESSASDGIVVNMDSLDMRRRRGAPVRASKRNIEVPAPSLSQP